MTTKILEKKVLQNIRIDDHEIRTLLSCYNKCVKQFVEQLEHIVKQYEEQGYFNIRISSAESRMRAYFILVGDRLESDKELAIRQARADGISKSKMLKKHKQLQQDLEILKKLQKEYGEDLTKLKVFESDNES
jgi:hypothetical protein